MIHIPENLPNGSILWLDEQAFEFAGHQDHQKANGEPTELRRWLTNCAGCGCALEALTPTTATISTPKRRCAECAKPGKPVVGKRGRKMVVRIELP